MIQNQNLFKKIEDVELKARDFGFYWTHLDELVQQIQSECVEVQEAFQNQHDAHLKEEIGDLLLAAMSLSIYCQVDPEQTLRESLDKFQKRFECLVSLVKQNGLENLQAQPVEQAIYFWKQAKLQLASK